MQFYLGRLAEMPKKSWLRLGGWGLAGAVLLAPATAFAQVPVLKGMLLIGATALQPSEAHRRVQPLLGQPADDVLLDKVRAAVAAAHDDAGLGLVAIDAPVLQDGIAVVRIHPLVLRQVEVLAATADGSTPPAPELAAGIAQVLPALRVGQTPDLHAVDRQLRLANLQPQRRWTIDFRSSGAAAAAPSVPAPAFASTPGQTLASEKEVPGPVVRPLLLGGSALPRQDDLIDARVTVSDPGPWYGRAMIDNAGQDATGRARGRLQLGHRDLLGPGRSVDVTALTSLAHPQRQQQLAVRLQNPVPAWGTLFALEFSRARSRPGVVQEFFGIAGDSRSFNLSARHLLARNGALEPYVEVGLESALYDDVIDFFGTNLGSKVGTMPLALALGATWQGNAWSVFGQARLRHNAGWGGHSGDAAYQAARAGATPRWTTADFAGEARRSLGGGHEAVLRGQAQWSGDALVSPQQFRAGGASLMRGLPEGEIAGDRGAAVAFEYWLPLAAEHRLGLLLDWAAVRRNLAQPGEPDSAHAASVGLAWNWQVRRDLRLQAIAARVVSAQGLPQSRSGDARLHLLLDWSF